MSKTTKVIEEVNKEPKLGDTVVATRNFGSAVKGYKYRVTGEFLPNLGSYRLYIRRTDSYGSSNIGVGQIDLKHLSVVIPEMLYAYSHRDHVIFMKTGETKTVKFGTKAYKREESKDIELP